MKYQNEIRQSDIGGMDFSTKLYKLRGAYPVDNTFEELSENTNVNLKVNTGELLGAPTCPCCGNQVAFAVCQCQQIHCIGDEEVSTCPGCGTQGRYQRGSGGFDVNRNRG